MGGSHGFKIIEGKALIKATIDLIVRSKHCEAKIIFDFYPKKKKLSLIVPSKIV